MDNNLNFAADEFKIVNHRGDETSAGSGLVLFNGGTVCDDDFNDDAAAAICKKMGYDGSHADWSVLKKDDGSTYGTFAWSIQNTYDIKLDELDCSGPNWKECTFSHESHDCRHYEDVFLSCNGKFSVLDSDIFYF